MVIIAYAITGFGMTKGIIDSSFSRTWHLGYLGAIGLVAFVIHTARAFYLELKCRKMWNFLTKTILILFYSALIFFFCYLQFFYQGEKKNTRTQIPEIQTNSSAIPGGSNTENTSDENANTKVFTAETLKQYNGLNGQPAYVAVSGVVYDVSTLFVNGEHYGCSAGQDVTEEFSSERHHRGNVLNGYEVVGVYNKN